VTAWLCNLGKVLVAAEGVAATFVAATFVAARALPELPVSRHPPIKLAKVALCGANQMGFSLTTFRSLTKSAYKIGFSSTLAQISSDRKRVLQLACVPHSGMMHPNLPRSSYFHSSSPQFDTFYQKIPIPIFPSRTCSSITRILAVQNLTMNTQALMVRWTYYNIVIINLPQN
jgi:hypothetical protein